MKYFGGCDSGSTYTKCVIIDENGKMVADVTLRSRINSVLSAQDALNQATAKVPELQNDPKNLAYLVGTGYGRNKVPFADENISEISCHAMGVHVADPSVKAIIDIGGQDVKGIAVDKDGTVLNFAMNDKCAAGTGRFFEAMARAFEMDLDSFSNLSLSAKNIIPITAQCTVFAESEVISLVGEGKPMDEIAAGIEFSVAKRCFVMAKKSGRGGFHYFNGRMRKKRWFESGYRKGIAPQSDSTSHRPSAYGCARRGRIRSSKRIGGIRSSYDYRHDIDCPYLGSIHRDGFVPLGRHRLNGFRRHFDFVRIPLLRLFLQYRYEASCAHARLLASKSGQEI